MTRAYQVGQAAMDAGWRRWVDTIGIIDYGRFRKAFLPILTDEYPNPDQLAETVNLYACHLKSLRPDQRRWDAKPEVLAQRFTEFYPLAALPVMQGDRMTARGELLTRPEGK